MNRPGKFDRNMEAVFILLKTECVNGPIIISNDEIAAACGFKRSRQVKDYLQKLKKQGRIFVRLDKKRVKDGGSWLNTRYIYTKPEV